MSQMKDKTLSLTVMQFSLIGAQHWYVTSSDYKIHDKFNHYEDALKYAKNIAYVKNIEIFD